MRCSLLTLSTYLDGELAPDRAGEVEAHLVACQRCSSGLGYLREEQAHIRALATVSAAPGAAEDLIGTVGLALLPAPLVPAAQQPTPPQPTPPQPTPQFLLDLAESPTAAAAAPPAKDGSYLELNGSPAPKAAPEIPATAMPSAEMPATEMRATVTEAAAMPSAEAPASEAPASGTPATETTEPAVIAKFGPETFAPQTLESEQLDAQALPDATAAAEPLEPLDSAAVTDAAEREAAALPAPHQWSQQYAKPEREPEVRAPVEQATQQIPESDGPVQEEFVDTAIDETASSASPPHRATPAPSAPALPVPQTSAGRAASWLDRARDALAVRWALMRGPSANALDDDDSIQIVSGSGAPARRGWRSASAADDTRPKPATFAGDDDAVAPSPAAPTEAQDISFAPPEHEPLRRPAFSTQERLAARAAMEKLAAEGALASDSASMQEPSPAHEPPPRSFTFDMQEPIAPHVPVPRPLPNADDSAEPGRHQRGLHRDGARFRVPSFAVPKRTRSAPPAPSAPWRPSTAGSPLQDRRLWIFGSVVVVLGLIGLLAGKSATPVPNQHAPGTVPNPTAIALPTARANATPTPAATPQPTPQPTATPVPTPAAPNPAQLTGAQNLGDGGTGFTVQDIRYGAHPGDFRIVFDLSGSGSPTTTVGFGNATTLYVVFTGATGAATVAQPPSGNTATAVKLLQPSPIAGKTIYELTLSGPAKLSTSYLQSPVRLVIDLS